MKPSRSRIFAVELARVNVLAVAVVCQAVWLSVWLVSSALAASSGNAVGDQAAGQHAVGQNAGRNAAQNAARNASPQNAAARESFDEFYERGQRANASIKTLTAHFVETTTSSLLTTPLVARGRLAVERPSRVVLHYEAPEPHVVLIDGNRMTMSWPGRNIRQVTDIGAAQGRVQKYFLNSTAADLRRQFEIQERDAGDRPGTHHVTMVPKRKQIRETLAELDLWVDRSTLLMSAMKMTFANGDTKLMVLDEVVKNAVLEPGTFSAAP
jgi:outer membrane lipoprotein-sorting protein